MSSYIHIITWLFYRIRIYFSYIILCVILSFVNLWRLFGPVSPGFGKAISKNDERLLDNRETHLHTLYRLYNTQSAGARYLARRVLCTNKLNAFHRRPPPLNASSPLDGTICRSHTLIRIPLRRARGRIWDSGRRVSF